MTAINGYKTKQNLVQGKAMLWKKIISYLWKLPYLFSYRLHNTHLWTN